MGFFGSGNKVTVQIVGDKGKLDKELRGAAKDVEGFGKKSSKSLITAGGLIKTAFAGVAAKAIFSFVGGTISAFSDLNESTNAVEVTMGDASEAILQLSDDAAESVGLSKSQFNDLAVAFSAFVETISEESGGDFAGTMDDLTTRVSDFASVMNLEVTEAARIFQSALAGETEPIRKFGIDLSAAAVTLEAVETGLVDTASEMTAQDKVLARYSLLMKATEKTAGDFVNTSDDLANATRILSAKWLDAQAVIGEALIPTLEDMFPLFESGIDLAVDWGISFGILTGAISDVDGAIRKSKSGLDKEATAIDFLFDATERLRKELSPGLFDTFGTLGGKVLPSAAGAIGKLLDETDNLAETFGLTADDADTLRENAEELADEMQFGDTEAVLALADRLDVDLVKAMQNISAKEGIKLLENTQDIRDAVLDGTDAVFGLIEGNEDLAEGLKDVQTEAEKAADRIERLRDKMRRLTDPAFALISAAKDYKTALDTQNEALDEYGEESIEAFDAGVDVLENYGDLISAASEYAETTNTDVVSALLLMGEKAGVPLAVVRDIIDTLNEADGFAGDLEFTIRYIESNRAALERFLDINVGPGGPGGGVDITFPTPDIGGIKHTGGRVNAPRGQEVLVRALGGEEFSNPAHNGGGGGGSVINYYAGTQISNTRILRELVEMGRRR